MYRALNYDRLYTFFRQLRGKKKHLYPKGPDIFFSLQTRLVGVQTRLVVFYSLNHDRTAIIDIHAQAQAEGVRASPNGRQDALWKRLIPRCLADSTTSPCTYGDKNVYLWQ